MGQICEEVVEVSTTGANGSATGQGTIRYVNGLLWDVRLQYHANAPATTDVTVSDAAVTILEVANNATSRLYAPRFASVDSANVPTGLFELFPLNGVVTVSVAQSNALSPCVTARLRFLQV